MMQNKLTEKKQIIFFFALCFLAYFSTYLVRLNFTASLVEIIRVEEISKGQAGVIGTAFFFAYGIGQLFSGFLGERLDCKWLVFAGLAISGIISGVMSLLSNPGIMTVVWCINGVAQAMIWSPLLNTICTFLDTKERLRFCMYINYSVPLGTVCAYGLSAFLIAIIDWRAAFWVPAVFVLGIACFWLVGMYKLHWRYEPDRKPQETLALAEKLKSKGNRKQNSIFFSSGLVFLIAALCVQGALKDGVMTWIPTYLGESYEMDSIAAILSTMVIPLCNMLGVAMVTIIMKWKKNSEIPAAAVFFGICGCALLILMGLNGSCAPVALLMLAIVTTSMMAVNALLISVLPSRFGSLGKASSVSGIMNFCVYVGCAVSTYGIGILSEKTSWNFTIFIWACAALGAVGICLGVNPKWKRYLKAVLGEEAA